MNRVGWFSLLAAALQTLGTGCSCEEEGDDGPAVIDAGEDAGTDAGFDASFEPPDSGFDAAMRDTGDLAGRCSALPDEVSRLTSNRRDFPPFAHLAVSPEKGLFGMAYQESGECLDALMMAELGSGEMKPERFTLFDECDIISVTAITRAGDHWLLVWVDDRERLDVWSLAYDPRDGKGAGERVHVGPIGMEIGELTAATLSDSVLVGWVEKDRMSGINKITVQPVDLEGEPAGPAQLVRDSVGVWFSNLVLAPFSANRVLLAYRSTDPARSEIVLQLLSAAGEVLAPSVALSGDAGDSGSIDIASDRSGGALVYSVVPGGGSTEVRFRRISQAGTALSDMLDDEVRLVRPPERARGASIAKLVPYDDRSGYVVAYRALPDEAGLAILPKIRVLFTDQEGHVQGSSDVYWAEEYGNRTSVKVTNDGRVAVSWSDNNGGLEEPKLVNLWCTQ